MVSRTSFFNAALFRKLVARSWPLWCFYLLVWAIALPISSISNLSYGGYFSTISQDVLYMGCQVGSIVCCVFAAFMAMSVYSFAFNSKSTSFFASLPFDRRCLFISAFAAGLLSLLGVNVVVFLLTLGVEAVYGTVGVGYLLQWLAMVCLQTLFFFGFASLCATLTGNLFILPAVYAMLLFAAWAVEGTIRFLLELVMYGMRRGRYIFNALSPVVYVFSETDVEAVYAETSYTPVAFTYSGWLALIIYGAVGAILAICALLIFRKRRMEAAGDVVAVRALRPVFKYCLAVGCALVLSTLICSLLYTRMSGGPGPTAVVAASLLCGAFIGFFAAEMLNRRSLRVFGGKNWAGLGIVAAALLALTLSCEFDLWGYERRLPEASEVTAVEISGGRGYAELESRDGVAAALSVHAGVIAAKAENERISGGSTLYFMYTLSDGSQFERRYSIDYEDAANTAEGGLAYRLHTLLNSVEAIRSRHRLAMPVTEENVYYASVRYTNTPAGERYPDEYTGAYDKYVMDSMATDDLTVTLRLSPAEAVELYACMEADMAEGTIGLEWLIEDHYPESVYDCTVNIDLRKPNPDAVLRQEFAAGSAPMAVEDDYRYESVYLSPTVWSVHTNKWLTEHGVELMLRSVTNNW